MWRSWQHAATRNDAQQTTQAHTYRKRSVERVLEEVWGTELPLDLPLELGRFLVLSVAVHGVCGGRCNEQQM